MATTEPYWAIIWSAVGISALLSTLLNVVLSAWLGSRRDQQRWILDNKKAEWKQLLTDAKEVLDAMEAHLGTLVANPLFGPSPENFGYSKRARLLLADQVFIAESLDRGNVAAKWNGLTSLVTGIKPFSAETKKIQYEFVLEFKKRQEEFWSTLLDTARSDLKLPPLDNQTD